MGWFLYHIVSGHAFFSGIAFLCVALLWRTRWAFRGASILRTVLFVLGLLLILASATPLPWALYGSAIVVTVIAVLYRGRPPFGQRCAAFAMVIWLAMAVLELPRQFLPPLPASETARLYVIGDSVSAGMGEPDEVTWPELLAEREPDLDVRDFSRIGATAASARKQAERIDGPGIVLLEIGGNDLLGPGGGTSPEDFERDLHALLKVASGKGRVLTMFELPLPPGGNRYGAIQRKLARDYGVALIPKRVLFGVLATPGATLDSIHLTRSGHDRMCEIVRRFIAPAVLHSQ